MKRVCAIVENGSERYIKNIKATTNANEVGKVDLAIVFVKSTITDIAVKQNSAVFGEKNGSSNITKWIRKCRKKISTVVNSNQIIAGTSANGASMIEPGKINHAGSGGTTIGEIDGAITDRIKELQRLLDVPKLGPCNVSDNVMGGSNMG